MMNKREAALGLLAGVMGFGLTAGAGVAAGAQAITEDEARQTILNWIAALETNDATAVSKFLAPEFQIMRSNGKVFTKESYLKGLSGRRANPKINEISVTSHGVVAVVCYILTIDGTLEGQKVQSLAPRLTVLRKGEEGWLIAAHANFAQLG
jgi:ketosteroid isomerase-like protein